MHIGFHGAAQTVTGSKHVVTTSSGKNILLDCGMFQGMGPETNSLNADFGFEPREIDYMILSHAHIDHCGLIPKLVTDGYRGSIYATPATKDLASVLLEDSAGIQEADVKYLNKKRSLQGLPMLSPLYTTLDAMAAIEHFVDVDYEQWYRIDEQIEFCFSDAGHIIGSAAVHLKITENNKTTRITFSGDVGRYKDMILRSPSAFSQADHILIESTYGNSLHEQFNPTPDKLLEYIERTCLQKKGKLILPAFSVGRTQEILFALNQLGLENRLPALQYIVDSPLSIKATNIVKRYAPYFNNQIQEILKKDADPFDFPGLIFTKSVEDSKRLNFLKEPCVIISASGMAEAGRVKHHISNNIEDSRNTILLTGYCEPNSLGGKLKKHPHEVSIFGQWHQVNAEIGEIRSMSAHGDYLDLIHFLEGQDPQKLQNLFLVHGEPPVQHDFKEKLEQKGFRNVMIPRRHEEVVIG